MPDLKLTQNDTFLKPFENTIKQRMDYIQMRQENLTQGKSLKEFSAGHLYYGLHLEGDKWVYRDWLPASEKAWLIGDFSNWQASSKFQLTRKANGVFELQIKRDLLQHGMLYRLLIQYQNSKHDRIPAYAQRVVKDENTGIFNAQIWQPKQQYKFKYKKNNRKSAPLIYESHVGMASEEGKVATFKEFTQNVIHRIAKAGYNTIQLMAIQEHPYYGSFGYHVSSYFAVSHLFGTPDDLKQLIDTAHKHNLDVIMDIVHSHAVKNKVEGISHYDGTEYQFFHKGKKGHHPAWDSRCFDYRKNEVVHFLLSNIRFWLEEYQFDGFRFDGVTSMIYFDHGLGTDFTDYSQYYNDNQDLDAITYLTLANKLIHEIDPNAISIAEEMSGMPGLATPINEGGYGFDYRMAMGVPDFWIKLLKTEKDENWHVGNIFFRLTDKRDDEKVISYAESHDQALVGDKTLMFRLTNADIYEHMHIDKLNSVTERAISLHKIIRLLTMATAGGGYLNFMGNEFGHPEWIDFPREGNGWSYHYARRQWSLEDNPKLGYHFLAKFDEDMVHLLSGQNVCNSPKPQAIVQDNYNQILAFKRADMIYVFNLNPFQSHTNYAVETPNEGRYKIVLNSDCKKYLGYGRIDDNFSYETYKNDGKNYINLYLPTRTAIILKADF